jgi:hypothetical protein
MLRFERAQQERVVYCFLKMPIISSKTNDELTFQYHVSFVLMNKMVLYLNIFLIILNVQKDSLSYSWFKSKHVFFHLFNLFIRERFSWVIHYKHLNSILYFLL